MLPNPILQGIEKDANILILNTEYVRPRKIDKGKYTPDYLYVVYRDLETNKKKLQIITNPRTDIYTTKSEFMNDFNTQRESLSMDMVDKHTVPFKDIERFLIGKLKENLLSERDRLVKETIDRAMELGKWNGRKEVHKWRHAYYSDYDIQDYVFTTANLYYEPERFKFTKSYLDIEIDVYGYTKTEQERGVCPVTAITMIYDYAPDLSKNYKPKVFTYLLRDYSKYKQQEEFERNLDKFMQRVHSEFDKKFGEADYKIIFFDDEVDLLYTMFKVQHMLKPDFTQIWNMAFDILYIQKRLSYLDIDPAMMFCHPDFKNTYISYYLDERAKNDFKNRGDHFNCLSYTKYIDQMLTYAARRKGGKDYGRNSLDNIASIELNEKKRLWDKPSTTIVNAAHEEYENFVLYSMQDVWLQVHVERKVEDVDDLFMKGYESGTRIDKANRQTVAIKNLWTLSHFNQGSVIGNNLNANYLSNFGEEDEGTEVIGKYKETLVGALVGDPTNLNNTGVKIHGKKRSNRLFLDDIDLDFGGMYPNIKLVNNISRSTQYGRLIIQNKVSPLEYGLNPHLRGGEFVEDYETGDYIRLGIKWFGLRKTEKYIKEFMEYIISNRYKLVFKKYKLGEFFNLWSNQIGAVLANIFPGKEALIPSFLTKVFKRDVADIDCSIYNNYDDIEYTTTLLSVVDWIGQVKPILTESGTFFKRHEESELSPGLKTIDDLLKRRGIVKDMELNYEQAGNKDEARMCNLRQNRIKIFTNSEYGASGNKGSFSYNYHCSQSVTSKGQTLISLAMTTFEDFISDTIQLYDFDELMVYCNNIIREDPKYDDSKILDRDKTHEEVKKRLLSKCKRIDDIDEDILDTMLENVPQQTLNRLYYKSNLTAFIDENHYIQDLIRRYSINTTSFMDPNSPPKHSLKQLRKLTNIILDYVQYNYPYYARVDRLIRIKRNSVIIIDTDSNIITVHDLRKKFQSYMDESTGFQIYKKGKINRVKEEHKLKSINMIAYILTEVITRTLDKFKRDTNAHNHPMGKYVMKNEFYFEAMLVTEGKKRYMGPIRMREGRYFETPRREIKGLDFMKVSFASEFVRTYIEDTLFDHVVTENMNLSKALNKLIKLEDIIRESLRSRKKDFLTEAKVSTIDAYVNPFSTGSFKATYIWNKLYPEKEITLPNNINMIKISIKSIKDIAPLALEDRDMFERISEVLKDPNLKTGITQIAIPLDEEIPEWMVDYIDTETMVNKNLKLAQPILEEIGIQGVYKKKSDTYISNIISIG